MIDANKKLIRDFLLKEKKIESPIGTINVKSVIGEGGNALVFCSDFGKNEVALKVLAEDVDSNSSKYKRFLTEFKEIVQLAETRAVVPIYFYGHLTIDEKKFPYILMKKYPYTLKSWIKEIEINNFNDLKPILKNLLDIVSVIHNHKIVHRDLKPENILVTENGEMVLADFGISWFDPNFYERLVHTKKGDRMANVNFSAPEQFSKENEPHYTMDIFSLGQIITWIITGSVARGNRTPLTTYDKSFSIIDPIVKKMLAESPEERPQTIEEVRVMLNNALRQQNEQLKLNKEIERVMNDLTKFNDVLLFCFPGKRGLIETDNQTKIDLVINQLNEIIDETNLWWTQGYSNCPIDKKMYKIDDETWVMDSKEIRIEKLWALKSGYSYDYQFLLIKTKAMPSFDIYADEPGFYAQEAAWFKDRYISRQEYDDGVAEIDGKSVWLEGNAELRIRNLQPQYYFIATNSHPILLMENDQVVSEVYNKLLKTDKLDEEDVNKLLRLKRHRISVMLS
jgi:serine/threonine protein kinase